jgi:L-asparaginase / beta-aspartyl-peptidase
MLKDSGWSLILHGGAKEIASDEQHEHRDGVADALSSGVEILQAGGTALEAVEAVVRVLEANPIFNAGIGAVKNRKGEVELDASIMDGRTLDIGAVAGLQGFKHPVSVARAMLREKPILLVGDGAVEFALRNNAEQWDLGGKKKSSTSASDTVGCVARDRDGHLAAASSSGGLEGAEAGRVGDVAMPGGGFYADDQRGAVALSGEGEAIARVMVAGEVIRLMQTMPVQDSLQAALRLVGRVNGEAGMIAISPAGEVGWTHNSAHFAVAYGNDGEPHGQTFLSRDEAI